MLSEILVTCTTTPSFRDIIKTDSCGVQTPTSYFGTLCKHREQSWEGHISFLSAKVRISGCSVDLANVVTKVLL